MSSLPDYFTAAVPDTVTDDGDVDQQYGYSARARATASGKGFLSSFLRQTAIAFSPALMAIQRYFAGAPFNRQQTLQQLFGFPVAASTVFDQCEQLANAIRPLFAYLLVLAAQANLFLIDDTGNRILTQGPVIKPDRRTGKPKQRSGVYTSGAIAVLDHNRRCVLYQTNVGHAGEWLDEILSTRPATAPPPTVMSDALNRNRPIRVQRYHEALCNAHARRGFVDVASRFPEQVDWVLVRYARIWHHQSEHCQELSPVQRLAYHREHSLPIMAQIRDHGQQGLDSGEIEENSALGEAWRYFINHYDGLTAFCRIANAPIDNNEMEQGLKVIIRGRNNSLFFKTPAGAAIADVITSVVATAHRAGANGFDYLVALQRYADAVKKQPDQWLPWNYQQAEQDVRKAA